MISRPHIALTIQPNSEPPRGRVARLLHGYGWLAVLLTALPIALYAFVWAQYAVNIPKWDDHAVRAFLLFFDQETSFSGKVFEFFRQHNEHRIVYTRLIAWLDYTLLGKLSYVHLMVVGNASLLALLLLFRQVLRKEGRSIWFLPPVALLLFNLSHWENMYWGMAAIQNFTVVFWIMGIIYLLSYTNHHLAAFGLALLATLTSGNGLVSWPIGIGLLVIQLLGTPVSGRNWRPLLGWIVGAMLVGVLYFTGYKPPVSNPATRPLFSQLIKGWLAFIGSSAEAFPGPIFRNCLLLGAGMLLFLLLLIGRVLTQRTFTKPASLFLLGSTAFLLGTSAIVAWSRTGFGLDTLITSRYKIYSLTLLAVLFVYGVTLLTGRWRLYTGLLGAVFSLLLAALSYSSFLDDTIRLRKMLTSEQYNWLHTTNKPKPFLDAVAMKYVGLTPQFYDSCSDLIAAAVPATQLIQLDTLYRQNHTFFLKQATFPVLGLRDAGAYVRLRSNRRTYLFPTEQTINPSRRRYLLGTSYLTNGFTAAIAEAALQPGRYDVAILSVQSDHTCQLYPTGRQIETASAEGQTIKTNW